jgi:uncharacterized damage-inducible protein DinB
MKRLMQTLVTCLVLAVGSAGTPAAAQSVGPVQTEVLRDWVAMKDRMMKIADAMPEAKFDYKSTPAQRNYGEQILHVATVNVRVLQLLQPKTPPPAMNAKATSKSEILKALADAFDWGTTIIKERTSETMLQVVQVPDVLRFLGDSTQARLMYFLIGHTWDIYGQMAVYLRLNGIVPPASVTP